MKDRSKLTTFFVMELVVLLAVVTAFKLIPEKTVAGMVGGTLFVSLGAYICIQCMRSKRLKPSATLVMGLIHLFVTSLPMMITRILNFSTDFSEVRILGIPGPAFHGISSSIFLVLIGATLFDFGRLWRSDRAGKNA